MAPKLVFTKEKILETALNITRESGIKAVTARNVAQKLGSSVKPIFNVFSNMEELQNQVTKEAYKLYQDYIIRFMTKGELPPYKASGIGYISFARKEKELFKLLFMSERKVDFTEEDKVIIKPIIEIIKNNLSISEDEAYNYHTEMWVFVHGIATMTATSYLDLDMDFIDKALSDVFIGLNYRYKEGKNL